MWLGFNLMQQYLQSLLTSEWFMKIRMPVIFTYLNNIPNMEINHLPCSLFFASPDCYITNDLPRGRLEFVGLVCPFTFHPCGDELTFGQWAVSIFFSVAGIGYFLWNYRNLNFISLIIHQSSKVSRKVFSIHRHVVRILSFQCYFTI